MIRTSLALMMIVLRTLALVELTERLNLATLLACSHTPSIAGVVDTHPSAKVTQRFHSLAVSANEDGSHNGESNLNVETNSSPCVYCVENVGIEPTRQSPCKGNPLHPEHSPRVVVEIQGNDPCSSVCHTDVLTSITISP
jgi:hypothetical protein